MVQAIVQAVYQSAFNNLTANGSEFPAGFVLPWVHKDRFVRIPRYKDQFCTFSGATAFIKRNGEIIVRNSFGQLRGFTNPYRAGQFLAEV